MPYPEPKKQRNRAHSHLRNLERLRKKVATEPKLPDPKDRSVLIAAQKAKAEMDRVMTLERFGKENRRDLTLAEKGMEAILKQLGWRFNCEHPIGNYIVDFYVPHARLCIEVDGGYHFTEERQAYDKTRDAWIRRQHRRVIRYRNEQVLSNPTAIAIFLQRKFPVR